jgi:hypothetical protein
MKMKPDDQVLAYLKEPKGKGLWEIESGSVGFG